MNFGISRRAARIMDKRHFLVVLLITCFSLLGSRLLRAEQLRHESVAQNPPSEASLEGANGQSVDTPPSTAQAYELLYYSLRCSGPIIDDITQPDYYSAIKVFYRLGGDATTIHIQEVKTAYTTNTSRYGNLAGTEDIQYSFYLIQLNSLEMPKIDGDIMLLCQTQKQCIGTDRRKIHCEVHVDETKECDFSSAYGQTQSHLELNICSEQTENTRSALDLLIQEAKYAAAGAVKCTPEEHTLTQPILDPFVQCDPYSAEEIGRRSATSSSECLRMKVNNDIHWKSCFQKIQACTEAIDAENEQAFQHNDLTYQCQTSFAKRGPPLNNNQVKLDQPQEQPAFSDFSKRLAAAKQNSETSDINTSEELKALREKYDRALRETQQQWQQRKESARRCLMCSNDACQSQFCCRRYKSDGYFEFVPCY